MNLFNPLLKELFEISGQNIKPAPQQRKAAPKKPKPAAEPPKEEKIREIPKAQEIKNEPKERTVAGISLNSQTVRQGIIMSEILGKPLSKRR